MTYRSNASVRSAAVFRPEPGAVMNVYAESETGYKFRFLRRGRSSDVQQSWQRVLLEQQPSSP